jgi:hypothetical protein
VSFQFQYLFYFILLCWLIHMYAHFCSATEETHSLAYTGCTHIYTTVHNISTPDNEFALIIEIRLSQTIFILNFRILIENLILKSFIFAPIFFFSISKILIILITSKWALNVYFLNYMFYLYLYKSYFKNK